MPKYVQLLGPEGAIVHVGCKILLSQGIQKTFEVQIVCFFYFASNVYVVGKRLGTFETIFLNELVHNTMEHWHFLSNTNGMRVKCHERPYTSDALNGRCL